MKYLRATALTTLLVLNTGVQLTQAEARFTVIPIDTLGGSTFAVGINNIDQVIVQAHPPVPNNFARATIFTTSDGLQDLGTLPGGTSSFPRGINDLSEVVGYAQTTTSPSQTAFFWRNGVMTELEPFPEQTFARAHGINNSSEIAGVSGPGRAVVWRDGIASDLGTLRGAPYNNSSTALAINNLGHVVGRSNDAEGYPHAFIWKGKKMTDLGTLGLKQARGIDGVTVANDINDLDQVVGHSRAATGPLRAFLWQDGQMTDLGSFRDSGSLRGSSFAFEINNAGQIVGQSDPSDGSTRRAFLYENGTLLNLNDLIDPNSGWDLIIARAINDAGHIVGDGRFNGDTTPYLLIPVIHEPVMLPGDANLDGIVSFADFVILQSNFDMPGGFTDGDFNGDGFVTFADFVILQTNFGMTASPAVIPEPATLTLLALGSLTLLRRRRYV